MSTIWYKQPAKEWEEALPIGNGRLGAMIYGDVYNETLQVNEESMFYGGKVQRLNPDFKENLPKIRALLDQGKISEAEHLMKISMSGCPESQHPYQTLGEIKIEFDNHSEPYTNYKRALDMYLGVSTVSYQVKNTTYIRTIFASKPADAIVIRMETFGEDTLNFSVHLRRERFFDGAGKFDQDCIELYGNLGRGGYEFQEALRAKFEEEQPEGAKIETIGETLRVTGAKSVVLYFTADTTYHYSAEELDQWVTKYRDSYHHGPLQMLLTDAQRDPGKLSLIMQSLSPAERHFLANLRDYDIPGFSASKEMQTEDLPGFEKREYMTQAALQAFLAEKIVNRLLACDEKGIKGVLVDHVMEYQSLFCRFDFHLAGEEAFDSIPTDERLQKAAEGNVDIGLSKVLLYFGRYLTICCSREGGLPSTLQGLWNWQMKPSWDSKFTININTEMNYWPVESAHLSECHLPLFDLLSKMQKDGRRTAREMYGCRGFVAHHNTDIHGDTAPQDLWIPGSYWPMGAAWIATHLWTHYLYTKDEVFLKKAFPVLAESALFFVDFLIERNGYLVTSPSVSPENSYKLPNGEVGAVCIGATMDNQILRHLFGAVLSAWDVLGQKEPDGCTIPDVENIGELVEQIRICKERLVPTRISESGRIMEWPEDYEEMEPGHRHISHLYGLFPSGEITVDQTPELAAAARKTLEYRLSHGGGHTGWSRAWIINHYASLWDGEKAYENIEAMLGKSTYPNMFDKHPPFQIDGNFGACAGIINMLAQSSEERLVLLPALPSAWPEGYVRGLCVVGNAEIAMEWKDSKLLYVEIEAHSDYETDVIYQGMKRHVVIPAGQRGTFMF